MDLKTVLIYYAIETASGILMLFALFLSSQESIWFIVSTFVFIIAIIYGYVFLIKYLIRKNRETKASSEAERKWEFDFDRKNVQ